MSDHTVQSFDIELNAITRKIDALAQLAERQLGDAMWAVRHSSRDVAQAVQVQDQQLGELTAQIDEDVIQLIARHQPSTTDLRHAMATIRIAANLERTGDLSSNMAKRALAAPPNWLPKAFAEPLLKIAELAQLQLHDAHSAFVNRDIELAKNVGAHDATMDVLRTMIFQDIVEAMTDDQPSALDLAQLLFVIESFERIRDHAANTAENVVRL